jgi:large subunit ribosomal protein L25
MLILNAKTRELKSDKAQMRKGGDIPAVFYGPKEASTPIIINEVEFMKAYKEAGESSIITLKIGSDEHDTLLKDVQFDAVSLRPLHADFYVIEKGKKLRVNVPLEFVGVSPAVKNLGGILVKVAHEIEIEAMPKNLPHNIVVSIDGLVDFNAQVHAGDLTLPEGVELISGKDEVIALVKEPKEEKEEVAAPVDLSSIEVEKKGKKDEEGVPGGTPAEEKK